MQLIWEMKKKRILYYLKGPLIIFLIVSTTLLTSWTLHVLYAIYTDTQAHMSIYEWMDYLYAMLL
jgi:hypothetical protein